MSGDGGRSEGSDPMLPAAAVQRAVVASVPYHFPDSPTNVCNFETGLVQDISKKGGSIKEDSARQGAGRHRAWPNRTSTTTTTTTTDDH